MPVHKDLVHAPQSDTETRLESGTIAAVPDDHSAPITERWVIGILIVIAAALMSQIWTSKQTNDTAAVSKVEDRIRDLELWRLTETEARVGLKSDVGYIIKTLEELRGRIDEHNQLVERRVAEQKRAEQFPKFGRQ